MDPKEEQIRNFIKLFREQSLLLEPDKDKLEHILANLPVTDLPEMRYSYKEVNIISPFYQYMTSTMKVLVALVVVALFAGGVAYFKLAPSGEEAIVAVQENDFSEADLQLAGGDEDIASLIASLGQEQTQEVALLDAGDVDPAVLSAESSLVGEINQTYQDEL